MRQMSKAHGRFKEKAMEERTHQDLVVVDGRVHVPNIEISSKNIVHVVRDEKDKKKGTVETYTLARCERRMRHD